MFGHHTLRDVVEACSSSHPEACVGIAWKGGTGITFAADGTQVPHPRGPFPGPCAALA